jgi:hypothetical protein
MVEPMEIKVKHNKPNQVNNEQIKKPQSTVVPW